MEKPDYKDIKDYENEKDRRRASVVWHIEEFNNDYTILVDKKFLLVQVGKPDETPDIKLRFSFRVSKYPLSRNEKKVEIGEYLEMVAELVSPDPGSMEFNMVVVGTSTCNNWFYSDGLPTFIIGSDRPTVIIPKTFLLYTITTTADGKVTRTMNIRPRPKHWYIEMLIHTQLGTPKSPKKPLSPISKSMSPADRLCRDMERLFLKPENFKDVALKTRDGKTIECHRFVLAARSPYFAKKLLAAIDPGDETGTIQVNCGHNAMNVVLHWMYTGRVSDEVAKCCREVAQLAVDFEMKDIMDSVNSVMVGRFHRENKMQALGLQKMRKEDVGVY